MFAFIIWHAMFVLENRTQRAMAKGMNVVIFSCITHIAEQLNQYLRNSFDLNEDIVIVSNLIENDGSVVAQSNNKIVVFLANMEKDTMPQRQTQYLSSSNDRLAVSIKPLYLNLSVVIAANFTGANYQESLKFISQVVTFFQQQPVFDHHNSPDLDPRIQKLILDIENVPRHDLSSMWGMFGAKYLPSIIYRVRMATLDGAGIHSQVAAVRQTTTHVAAD